MKRSSRILSKRKESRLLDYTDCKEIDKFHLDDELIRQPQLFYEYSAAYAESQIKTQNAKDKYDLKKAELEIKIKENPQKYGLKKDTDSTVKAKILTMPEIQELNSEYIAKLRIEKMLSKAERAFEHRKKSLEGLVTLQVQNYFSQPKMTETQTAVDSKELVRSLRKKKRREKSG